VAKEAWAIADEIAVGGAARSRGLPGRV